MWRPKEGWAKTRDVWLLRDFSDTDVRQKAYEAGADAMLTALRAEEVIRPGNKLEMISEYVIKIKDFPGETWRVLLIPKEVKDGE